MLLPGTDHHGRVDFPAHRGVRERWREAKQWMHEKLAARAHPLSLLDPQEAAPLIPHSLRGLDGDSWVDVWGKAGDRTA